MTRPIGDYKRNEWRTPEEAEKGKAFYAPVVQVLRYLQARGEQPHADRLARACTSRRSSSTSGASRRAIPTRARTAACAAPSTRCAAAARPVWWRLLTEPVAAAAGDAAASAAASAAAGADADAGAAAGGDGASAEGSAAEPELAGERLVALLSHFQDVTPSSDDYISPSAAYIWGRDQRRARRPRRARSPTRRAPRSTAARPGVAPNARAAIEHKAYAADRPHRVGCHGEGFAMKGHADADSVGLDAFASCPTQFRLDPRHVSLAARAAQPYPATYASAGSHAPLSGDGSVSLMSSSFSKPPTSMAARRRRATATTAPPPAPPPRERRARGARAAAGGGLRHVVAGGAARARQPRTCPRGCSRRAARCTCSTTARSARSRSTARAARRSRRCRRPRAARRRVAPADERPAARRAAAERRPRQVLGRFEMASQLFKLVDTDNSGLVELEELMTSSTATRAARSYGRRP